MSQNKQHEKDKIFRQKKIGEFNEFQIRQRGEIIIGVEFLETLLAETIDYAKARQPELSEKQMGQKKKVWKIEAEKQIRENISSNQAKHGRQLKTDLNIQTTLYTRQKKLNRVLLSLFILSIVSIIIILAV